MQIVGGPAGRPPRPAEELATVMRRMNPPDNEIPVLLGWSAELARSATLAVLLTRVEVYTTGLVLVIAVRTRQDPGTGDGRRFGPDTSALIGIEVGDGRVAVAAAGRPTSPAADERLQLHMCYGAQFGSRNADMRFLLTPLPPPGPLTVHYLSPESGIAETATQFDSTAITAAVDGVQVLWDPPPVEPFRPDPEPEPELPQGSWFAGALRAGQDG